MAMSGIKISDHIKNTFDKINENYRKKTADEKAPLRYAVFKFNDADTEIIVHEEVEPKQALDYKSLIDTLPPNDVRYLAYDFQFKNPQGQPRRKVILISWVPETSTIKRKMLASSTFNALKNAVNMRKDYIEADELPDISESIVAEKLGGTVYTEG